MPARIRKPKDKVSAESAVDTISTRIIAALRNRKVFSLLELYQAVHERPERHNQEPFTQREDSRSSVFQTQEREFLQKLPISQFELPQWKIDTVQYNITSR